LDQNALNAIQKDRLIDITTIGRRSGKSYRKEVLLRQLDGQPYLSHTAGPRDWAANLLANPSFTYHLKESINLDLPARATEITDTDQKRIIIKSLLEKEVSEPLVEDALGQIDARVTGSHLFHVEIL
tara:strand:- start:281 stop:661 length:381 start_codon:yes stop_codon:yes gene_type:complete